MKMVILLGVLGLVGLASAGYVPASTTLLKSAPISYTQPLFTAIYQQPIYADYASAFIPQSSLFAQQQLFAQYPGLFQYPVVQNPVVPQAPAEAGPVIEAADPVPFPALPSQPAAPIQQSPVLGNRPGSGVVDDDTVSVEAAA